jgi:hypothetical protein
MQQSINNFRFYLQQQRAIHFSDRLIIVEREETRIQPFEICLNIDFMGENLFLNNSLSVRDRRCPSTQSFHKMIARAKSHPYGLDLKFFWVRYISVLTRFSDIIFVKISSHVQRSQRKSQAYKTVALICCSFFSAASAEEVIGLRKQNGVALFLSCTHRCRFESQIRLFFFWGLF